MAEEGSVRRHWWVAVLLSLFLAGGAGHIYNGRPARVGYVIAGLVFVMALFHTSIPSTFPGFALAFVGFWIVPLVAALDAGISAWRHSTVVRQRYQRWYVYLAYGLALQLSLYGINRGALAALGEPSVFGAYKPYSVSSESSVPNLLKGDYFWVATARAATKTDLSRHVGSFAVLSWPDEPGSFVYRLVAVGGQRVAVREGAVVIDGKRLPQRKLCTANIAESGPSVSRWVETQGGRSRVVQYFDGADRPRNFDEVMVPDGQFFVLGDSRDNANDSRFRGPVANEDYAGRALFIVWSNDWSRIGRSLSADALVVKADVCPANVK
jgi:signal peptidase I